MKSTPKPRVILLADDDPDDRMLTREALEESGYPYELHTVEHGDELVDYLNRRGKYADEAGSPQPGVILLDLNMPGKDGREALREIKADTELRRIPVIVLTTSSAEEDIYRTYDLGADSFVVKPASFDGLVDLMRTLGKYWVATVDLPVQV